LDGEFISPSLPAGKYTVTLTDFELQQSPSATNLSEGFTSTSATVSTLSTNRETLAAAPTT
jgi:hypothetical protein